MQLQQLTERIFVAPGDMRQVRPWIGIIITEMSTVLIDSGNGTAHAGEIQAALLKIKAPPVSHIILTHHHWDHVFGNCIFPDAVIIAQELTQQHLLVMEAEPWSAEYVSTKAGDDPVQRIIAAMMQQAVPDWQVFSAVSASVVFSSSNMLELGSIRFLVEHVGGQHEPDQSIVHVYPDDVLFLGDATYGRGGRANWDLIALADELEPFLARGAQYYVEGHRNPASASVFQARITQLRNLAAGRHGI